MTTFIKVSTVSGREFIGEFEKVKTGQRYLTSVFAGEKVFNAWRVVGDVLPLTGEPAVMRTREMVSGAQIVSAEVVVPTVEDHEFNPANFDGATFPKKGENGTHMFGGEAPEGATAGAEYPMHREEGTLRRFVYLTYPDAKHYLDEDSTEPGDADEDFDRDW